MEKKKTPSVLGIPSILGTKKKKATPYSNLQKAKADLCKGKATVEKVQNAAMAYIKSAVAKGKTEKEAKATAVRITTASCRTTAPKGGIKTAIGYSKGKKK
jgi:hypothetical protein